MANVILSEGEIAKFEIELIGEEKKYAQAVFDHVISLRAGRRSGSANTKTRGEVAGSNAKPWRQKGTGRARAGEKRSPIWRGGGVVFGPKPRSYATKVNKKVARLALLGAITECVKAGKMILLEQFEVGSAKTKDLQVQLKAICPSGRILLISSEFDEPIIRAGRNIEDLKMARAADVNTEDLLGCKTVLVTSEGLGSLSKRINSVK